MKPVGVSQSMSSSRASSLDSWTLVGPQGTEVDVYLQNSGVQVEQAEEAEESPSLERSSHCSSDFARLSSDSELDEVRAEADNTLNAAMASETASESGASGLETELRSHPLLQGGNYVIDPAKLHRLLDALSAATANPSQAGGPSQRQEEEAAVDADGEDVISDELPVNWVQRYSERFHNYMHTANGPLNWKLSVLVTLAAALVLGLGIGHFLGTTHSWLRRHRAARQQLDQLRTLQDTLLSCLGKQEKAEAALTGLQYRLSTCLDVSNHCGVEDRPPHFADLAAARRLLRKERLLRRRAQRRLAVLKATARMTMHRTPVLPGLSNPAAPLPPTYTRLPPPEEEPPQAPGPDQEPESCSPSEETSGPEEETSFAPPEAEASPLPSLQSPAEDDEPEPAADEEYPAEEYPSLPLSLAPSDTASSPPSETAGPPDSDWAEIRAEQMSSLEARVGELERSLSEARTTIRQLSLPKACPPPTGWQKERIISDWLTYANLSQILDTYLDALRSHARLGGLGDDTARLVWDQLAQVRSVADRYSAQLSQRLGDLRQTAAEAAPRLRDRLQTALSQVWDLGSLWQKEEPAGDLFADMGSHLSSLQAFFAGQPQPQPPFPAEAVCPPLPPLGEPQRAIRQFRGALKRSSLWTEIGEAEMYPYLSELKKLTKQWPLSAEGRLWWTNQQLWWLGCGSGDAGLDWQGQLDRPAFLAANPGIASLTESWSRREAGEWLLARGRLREQLRREEARGDWLFQRGQTRSEKRDEEDPAYPANTWSERRGRGRSQARSRGAHHFRQAHFRSFA